MKNSQPQSCFTFQVAGDIETGETKQLLGEDPGSDDMLDGTAGSGVMDGGDGKDTVTYAAAAAGVLADLENSANNTGAAAGDSYVGIENLIGSGFGDTLLGNAGDNTIDGGAGADELDGRATHRVKLQAEGLEPMTVHVDAETGDVLRVERTHCILKGGVTAGEQVCLTSLQAPIDGMTVRIREPGDEKKGDDGEGQEK